MIIWSHGKRFVSPTPLIRWTFFRSIPLARDLLFPNTVIVAFSIHDGRISPVLDVARRFLLLQLHPDGLSHREVGLDSSDPVSKTKRLAEWGVRLVVCGAISWPLQAMLTAAGIQVIANTCGPVAEVEAAYLAGGLGGRAFLMPGCPGRQRRGRQRRRRGRGGWNR